MTEPFVETVRIQSFGCARDVRLELTRLHALIGPNDSGKSTVLAAIRTACELIRVGQLDLSGRELIDPRGALGSSIELAWGESPAKTELRVSRAPDAWRLQAQGIGVPEHSPLFQHSLIHPLGHDFAAPARGATMIRFDPDAIRQPYALIPEGGPLTIGEKGHKIPAIYEAVLSRDRPAFDAIEADVRRHFPTVRSIWLPTASGSEKGLGVTLIDGTRVPADSMSEGLLYWLAFAILPHVDPTAILLIEEPENGLHPSRIAQVMGVLRLVSLRTQVILATHSPLVINELAPEEVTLLTRDPDKGTYATRMDRTKHFQQREKVYALGELWLSFADGIAESDLVADDETSKSTG
ncbi:MAG: AAA family ATPase [Myxococcales bacterium]|nr:AAA family ATPase [Myxococcales bacterium]